MAHCVPLAASLRLGVGPAACACVCRRNSVNFVCDELEEAVQYPADLLEEGDLVLLYYAGHGVQLHHQWLCGVDAGHSRHTTSMPGCVPWASVMATIQDAGLASLRVILVRDCCANHFSAPASSSTGCSNCATVSSARLTRCVNLLHRTNSLDRLQTHRRLPKTA